jgi:hypothetical protein
VGFYFIFPFKKTKKSVAPTTTGLNQATSVLRKTPVREKKRKIVPALYFIHHPGRENSSLKKKMKRAGSDKNLKAATLLRKIFGVLFMLMRINYLLCFSLLLSWPVDENQGARVF